MARRRRPTPTRRPHSTAIPVSGTPASAAQIRDFRETVSKVVSMLSARRITVTQQGVQAYVQYAADGATPLRINLPVIPEDADLTFLQAVRGFLDHEVAHVLFTDMRVGMAERKADPRLHNMWNICEDIVIERRMRQRFPGSDEHLSELWRFIGERLIKPAFLKAGDDPNALSGVLLPTAVRSFVGDPISTGLMIELDGWKHMGPFRTAMEECAPLLRAMNDTQGAFDAAQEMMKVLHRISKEMKKEDSKTPPLGHAKGGTASDPAEGDDAGDKSEDKTGEKPGDKPDDAEASADKPKLKPDASEPEKADAGDDAEDAGVDEPAKADEPADEPADEDDGAGGDRKDDAEGESEDDSSGDEEGAEDGLGAEDGAGDDGDESADARPSGSSDTESDSHTDALFGDADADADADAEDSTHGEASDAASAAGEDGRDPMEALDHKAPSVADELARMAAEKLSTADYVVPTRDFDVIAPMPVGAGADAGARLMEDRVRMVAGQMQSHLRRMFAQQSHVFDASGYRSGRIHGASLHRMLAGDDRVFSRREEHAATDTAITLLVDMSGSMGGEKIKVAMESVLAFATTIERLGLAYEILGFTTTGDHRLNHRALDIYETLPYSVRRQVARYEPLWMPIFKSFQERLTPLVRQRIASVCHADIPAPLVQNADGECVRLAGWRLMSRREPRKILIVFSDGAPCCFDGLSPALSRDLQRAIKELAERKVETLGVGIMDGAASHFYPRSITIDRVEKLPITLMAELHKLLLPQRRAA